MAEKERKRKRVSDGVDPPNKKVAFQAGNSDQVKVHFNEDGSPPVLVSSPGLTTPATQFKAYTKPLSTRALNNASPNPRTHDLLLQSSKHPRLDYTASRITLDQHLSHYVGIFDPSTKKLQITPAHHLSLRSKLRTETKQSDQDKQRRTIGQQREDLGREFGTKKAKKVIAAKTVNAIVKDTKGKGKKDDVQDAILESIAESAVPTRKEEELLEAALASKPIPKPNLAAENVDDVYLFNTLIPYSDSRLVFVKDLQEKAIAGEDVEFKHHFPASRLSLVAKSEDILRLKALRYLQFLLEFHDALQNAGRSGKKVPKKEVLQRKLSGWPEGLIDSVRRRFANASNELPKWHMDNLYTHICALSLYVDGWISNMNSLKDDLKMENKEISQYFRELGCIVSQLTEKEGETMKLNKAQAAATRVVKLKLPLDFPKPRAGRRR